MFRPCPASQCIPKLFATVGITFFLVLELHLAMHREEIYFFSSQIESLTRMLDSCIHLSLEAANSKGATNRPIIRPTTRPYETIHSPRGVHQGGFRADSFNFVRGATPCLGCAGRRNCNDDFCYNFGANFCYDFGANFCYDFWHFSATIPATISGRISATISARISATISGILCHDPRYNFGANFCYDFL